MGLRIVTVMEQPPPDQPVDRTELVSRRRLLQSAGTAGLVAAASACSTEPPAHPSSSPSPSPTATAASPAAIPPPEPLTSTAPTLSAPPAVMLCRDAWGARPARPGGTPHTLTHLTIHHSAVVLGDNSNAPGRIRQDQRYHQDTQGWIDIAYHVGVDRNGNIYELRSPELVGDTATTYDPTGHFLVLCEGDFDKEEVTEELLHGTALACAWGAQRFAIPTATLAHRDFAATSCPGANLYAHLASGDLKRRVEDLVAVGPVDLQQICGPEATAIVADIEAGLR